MKKFALVVLAVTVGHSIFAQPGSKPAKPVKPAPPRVIVKSFMKNLNDSASYVIGMSMAHFARQYGLSQLDSASLSTAFSGALAGKQLILTESDTYRCLTDLANGKKPAEVSPSTHGPGVDSYLDTVSYAIGMDRANFLKQQGINKMNIQMVNRGVRDVMTNQRPAISDADANTVMNKVITQIQLEKVKPNIDAGKKFLAENKKKKGVRTTKSGLQYEVIKMGTGIKPTAQDTFVAHYRGTLLDGTEFDASYNRNEPLVYPLLKVIKGWTEGLQLMPVGSKFKFYIPYELAYGPFDNPPIPGGSLLVFDLELLDVKKKKK